MYGEDGGAGNIHEPGSEHGEPQRQPAPLETGMSRHENTLAGICPFSTKGLLKSGLFVELALYSGLN